MLSRAIRPPLDRSYHQVALPLPGERQPSSCYPGPGRICMANQRFFRRFYDSGINDHDLNYDSQLVLKKALVPLFWDGDFLTATEH